MQTKYPKQTSWSIYYSDFSGLERKAVEFLNEELGKLLIREEGVYRLHVLPILKETADTKVEKNGVIVGTWQESALVRAHVAKEEIPENGYLVRVLDNPEDGDCSLVLITANDKQNLYYGGVAFVDKYIPEAAPLHGGLRFADRIFDEKLPQTTLLSAPKTATRSIFAWGHPINDYRAFIRNMARQGLNQLILWNDFKPLNAKDIVEYAHEYGIQLLWGFAWGWIDGCDRIKSIDDAWLANIKAQVISLFEKEYAGQGDGIYFQSFTERGDDNVNGRNIAEAVTDLVNDTAGALLEKYPDLHIQFGLHASSVKKNLSAIARVDKRIEILWEDCGAFPYAYELKTCDEQFFEETMAFTEKILRLRGEGAKTGLVVKGFATLDWTNGLFSYQKAPFILGENGKEIFLHDRKLRKAVWRSFTSDWLRNGEYAKRFAERVYKWTKGEVNLCQAGLFEGGIFAPQAICSEIFWNPLRSYGDIVRDSLQKPCVEIE